MCSFTTYNMTNAIFFELFFIQLRPVHTIFLIYISYTLCIAMYGNNTFFIYNCVLWSIIEENGKTLSLFLGPFYVSYIRRLSASGSLWKLIHIEYSFSRDVTWIFIFDVYHSMQSSIPSCTLLMLPF